MTEWSLLAGKLDVAATPTKPAVDARPEPVRAGAPVRPASPTQKPTGRDALQALLAFSALHDQVRRRKTLAAKYSIFDAPATPEFEPAELFALDEVLQLVAERGVSITGADGLAIALADNNEILLRAAAGTVCPDVGQRIDRDSAFSGACFRTAQVIRCDDTENDPRVNLSACRRLGARSMVAVPLCGRRRVIGVLEAFSAEPMGFNESDVRNLELLAEIILGALKPEDEDRFASSAGVAVNGLATSVTHEPVAAIPAEKPAPVPAIGVPAPIVSSPIPVSVPPAAPGPTTATVPATVPSTLHLVESSAPAVAEEAAVKSPPPLAVVKEPAVPAKQPDVSVKTAAEPEVVNPIVEDISSSSAEPQSALSPATEELPPAYETVGFESLNQPPESSRSVVLLLLLIIVAAVAAAGFWWRGTTAQIGHAMIRRTPAPGVQPDVKTNATSVPNTLPTAPAAKSATASADSFSLESGLDGTTAATPQEISHMPHVNGLRHWSSADASTVTLDLDDQVQYEAHRLSNPERIYFDLHDTALAPALANKVEEVGDALLSRVRLAQPVPGITRLVLETRGASTFSVSLEPSPYRLVVTIRKPGTEPKPQAELFPGQAEAEAERMKLAIVVPPPTKEDIQLRAHVPKMRVVVDAGHGGWDLGTVGRKGLLEKDVALEVAQRLGKLLESRLGFSVILTRSDDTYIPLDQRSAVANQSQADLFISIHANYSDLPSARGVETYYSRSFASSAHSAESGGKPLMPVILSPADLREKVQDSARLAESVQHTLYATLAGQNPGIRNRGVKPAGFAVLNGTSMPAILAEISFVSSPADEQKLLNDGYREQIAEALYRGIAHYAASGHGVKIASAARQ